MWTHRYSRVQLPKIKIDGHKASQHMPWLFFVLALFAAGAAFAADSADPKRYLEDVKTLSAPALEGRGAGTKGIALAANYIEDRYRSLGLQPAGTKSYFQPFTVITGARLKGANRLVVATGRSK